MAQRHLGKRFLLWCANEHNEFRIPEITSLATLFKINFEWVEKNTVQPYVLIDVERAEDVKKILSRSILVRSAYELWGRGGTHKELHDQLRQLPNEFMKPHADTSFCIKVEAFCKKLTMKQKVSKIEEFHYLPFEGPIDLKNPHTTFLLLECYKNAKSISPEYPTEVFFGRMIDEGQRDTIHLLDLKRRKFIGTTSMDPQLSLLMANQALVESNSLVFDPFVGSGSVMVAAAYFGGHIWGVDIDFKMLHGKAKPTRCNSEQRDTDESVATNLKQYNCGSRYMDVIVGDSSRSFWRDSVLFDSIITDPPYGIRESKEKVGKRKLETPAIKDEHLKNHIPSKVSYQMHDMYTDLVNYAAKHLKLGGRLVFWVPVFFNNFNEELIPKHPCFELVSSSCQELGKRASRYLITLKKIRHPESENDVAITSENMTIYAKQYLKTLHNQTQVQNGES